MNGCTPISDMSCRMNGISKANGIRESNGGGCESLSVNGDVVDRVVNGDAVNPLKSDVGIAKSPLKVAEKVAHLGKYEQVEQTANYLLSKTKHRPQIAIVCGTGLGGIGQLITDCTSVPYESIPNFVSPGVKGHAGRLLFGMLSGKCVVCMMGRIHAYEGHSMWQVTFPMRVFHRLGVRILLVTNASGSINPDYAPGDIMIIKDHINLPGLAGLNPLLGLNDERFGIRFPAMSDAYDGGLRALLRRIATEELRLDGIREGVYVCQTGPCFETVAECRMMRILGADVAGMSTTSEVIVARHDQRPMRVVGLSLITNRCVDRYCDDHDVDGHSNGLAGHDAHPSHDAILATAERRADDLRLLVASFIGQLDIEDNEGVDGLASTMTTNGH